jgi:hypothetical protein
MCISLAYTPNPELGRFRDEGRHQQRLALMNKKCQDLFGGAIKGHYTVGEAGIWVRLLHLCSCLPHVSVFCLFWQVSHITQPFRGVPITLKFVGFGLIGPLGCGPDV